MPSRIDNIGQNGNEGLHYSTEDAYEELIPCGNCDGTGKVKLTVCGEESKIDCRICKGLGVLHE